MGRKKSKLPHFGPLGGISDTEDLPGFYLIRIALFVVAVGVISYYVGSYVSEQTWYRDWLAEKTTMTKLLFQGLLAGTYVILTLAAWTLVCILAPLSPHPTRNRLLHFYAMAIATWTTFFLFAFLVGLLFNNVAQLPKLHWLCIEWTEKIYNILSVPIGIIFALIYVLANQIAKTFETSPKDVNPTSRTNP